MPLRENTESDYKRPGHIDAMNPPASGECGFLTLGQMVKDVNAHSEAYDKQEARKEEEREMNDYRDRLSFLLGMGDKRINRAFYRLKQKNSPDTIHGLSIIVTKLEKRWSDITRMMSDAGETVVDKNSFTQKAAQQ